jgi:putative transposase
VAQECSARKRVKIEGYNRQVRQITKAKEASPTDEAMRKLLFLASRNITRKWTAPVPN